MPENKKIDDDFVASIFTAIIGGLIGYGLHGTLQATCLGLGIGLAVPIAFIVFMAIINS